MDGKMYTQCDGIAMGSPLGPTFANFFMAEVENRALENIPVRPSLYCRYVDDIFTICEDDVFETLTHELELISGLSFTPIDAVDNRLPFLNVLVEEVNGTLKTTVYRKPTDQGTCMNASGESPNQYKLSVIKGFLFRAKTLNSDRKDMLLEISRAKQILINNGYSNTLIDGEIRNFLKHESVQKQVLPEIKHNVYYRNFMNTRYKSEEIALKKIIKSCVTMKQANNKLNVIIYYKTTKTKELFMKNNLLPKPRELAKSHLVYEFDCQEGECLHLPPPEARYTGLTTCTLSRRLSLHLQNGAIKSHFETKHDRKITRDEIVQWTKIRFQERDVDRLEILEALIILQEDPAINRQYTGKMRTLKVYGNNVSISKPTKYV